jgi:nicotinamide mononucleotide transporter
MEISAVTEEIRRYISTMPLLEAAGVIASLLYTILAAREKIICWLFGLISSAIYIYICFEAKLYQDTIINFYYFAMAVYGWILWNRRNASPGGKFHIVQASQKYILLITLTGLILTAASGTFFRYFTDASLPYIDAFTTVFAFIATWMQARKMVQNWIIFMVVDFVSIFMFGIKGYYFTSILFFIYTVICIFAYLEWQKKARISSASR